MVQNLRVRCAVLTPAKLFIRISDFTIVYDLAIIINVCLFI